LEEPELAYLDEKPLTRAVRRATFSSSGFLTDLPQPAWQSHWMMLVLA